jgi:hypothetical protein
LSWTASVPQPPKYRIAYNFVSGPPYTEQTLVAGNTTSFGGAFSGNFYVVTPVDNIDQPVGAVSNEVLCI